MKLDDTVIAHIAKILQMAMLTGTDIVDNLRQAVFCVEDNKIFLDPEYKEIFLDNIEKMLSEANASNPLPGMIDENSTQFKL